MSYQRIDSRGLDELRQTKITPNYLPYAEGSALIEVGGTKVICAASVEEKVPMFMRNQGRGWVTAEYSMLPRATAPVRPDAGDPAADRPQPAHGGGYDGDGRTHYHGRLRCAAGRRRNAH